MKLLGMEIYTELDSWKYWVHLIILATVALFILQVWKGGQMLSFQNVLYSTPILAVSDTIAHGVVKMR